MGIIWDIGLLLFVFATLYFGFSRGIHREVIRFGIAVIAIVAAWLFNGVIQWILRELCGVSYLTATFLAFPVVFLPISLIGAFVGNAIEKDMKWDDPTIDHRLYGGFFAFGRGTFVAFLIASLLATYPLPKDPMSKSKIVSLLRSSGVMATSIMPGPYRKPLATLARVNNNPEQFKAVLASPEVTAIIQSPKVAELLKDPQIIEMAKRQDAIGIMKHPKIEALMQDPAFQEQLKSLDIDALAARTGAGK